MRKDELRPEPRQEERDEEGKSFTSLKMWQITPHCVLAPERALPINEFLIYLCIQRAAVKGESEGAKKTFFFSRKRKQK
jgi:hypothetical protein